MKYFVLFTLLALGCSDGNNSNSGSNSENNSNNVNNVNNSNNFNNVDDTGIGDDMQTNVACEPACDDTSECASVDTQPVCVDVDECENDPCLETETCINLDPGFRCAEELQPIVGCGLEAAAFCEDFEVSDPGGRGGDIDESRWAISRWTHDGGNSFFRSLATSQANGEVNAANGTTTFCGEPADGIGISGDMRICDGQGVEAVSGQLHEIGHDTGDFLLNTMMIRQAFDFTDRVGKIVFDVDAKHNRDDGGHGWWIELFVSEDPVPLAYQESPSIDTQPRNGIGIEMTSNGSACNELGQNMVSKVVVIQDWQAVRNYESASDFDRTCFEATDGAPNRFEVRLGRDSLEVWGSDASTPGTIRLLMELEGINLNFERGFVSFHHVGYNAIKDLALPSQTYRWDNIGFDGPRLAPLVAYDIPNNVGQDFGYEIAPNAIESFTIENVVLGEMQQAFLNLNYLNYNFDTDATVQFRVNGGAWVTIDDYIVGHNPNRSSATARAFSAPIPVEQLNDGTNTIELRGGADTVEVANLDLSLF